MLSKGSAARWLAWWNGRASLLALDIAVALGASLFGLGPATMGLTSHAAALCVAGVALLVRRRYPLAVLLVVAACIVVALTPVPLMVALYSVASRHGVSLATGIGTVVGGLVEVATALFRSGPNLVLAAAVFGLIVVVPVLAGLWMFQRAALLAVLRDRIEEAERTRTLLADQAVSAERRHIAREMHDVVAHRVTAIALQAGALTLHAPDERTGQFAETIRSASTAALDELRGILRVLRDDVNLDQAPPRLVSAGLFASIETLVKDVVATGARVELVLPDPLPEVSDQIDRAVYRVVQESLTNARKHAPHAAVQVSINATAATLVAEVTNLLTPQTALTTLTPGTTNVPGSGYGLIGMRERVELAGGELWAGPSDGRVFRVIARFSLA